MTEERKVSERYRELGREEPPRVLDEAILAAARRAAETRPAPLVVPSGRRRWYFPLAAAAVIVLAVAVTMHIERERPGEEIITSPVVTPVEPAKQQAQTEKAKPAPQPERALKDERRSQYAPDPKPAATPPAQTDSRVLEAQRAQAEASVRANAERARDSVGVQAAREAAPAAPAAAPAARSDNYTAPRAGARPEANEQSRMLAKVQSQSEPAPLETLARSSPEQWLQGIADLRRQGRHEEADKSLAEFRRRYPDYRLSEEVRAKVERR